MSSAGSACRRQPGSDSRRRPSSASQRAPGGRAGRSKFEVVRQPWGGPRLHAHQEPHATAADCCAHSAKLAPHPRQAVIPCSPAALTLQCQAVHVHAAVGGGLQQGAASWRGLARQRRPPVCDLHQESHDVQGQAVLAGVLLHDRGQAGLGVEQAAGWGQSTGLVDAAIVCVQGWSLKGWGRAARQWSDGCCTLLAGQGGNRYSS